MNTIPIPLLLGRLESNRLNASRPPADAPTPTIGKVSVLGPLPDGTPFEFFCPEFPGSGEAPEAFRDFACLAGSRCDEGCRALMLLSAPRPFLLTVGAAFRAFSDDAVDLAPTLRCWLEPRFLLGFFLLIQLLLARSEMCLLLRQSVYHVSTSIARPRMVKTPIVKTRILKTPHPLDSLSAKA